MATDLARGLALALDPVLLAEATGMYPDKWQRDLLRSTRRQLILNCSRQAGKSTVSSLLALHTACYETNALVLLLAPALRQAQELFRKVKAAHGQLGARAVPIAEESALRIELANGARIVCLPGNNDANIRGFSAVSLLIVDEASRVRDDLYQALRPMLAVSRGRLVLLSTPFGARGFFHQEWTDGGPAWHRVQVTALDCPRIEPAWLEEERLAIGEMFYRSEYLCQFVDRIDQVFGYEYVQAALSGEVQPLFAAPTPALPDAEEGPWGLFL